MQLWTGRVMGQTSKKMVLSAMAYAPGAWINDVGTLISLQTVPYEFAWDNERVLAITLFRHGGARGTRDIWQLQEPHIQMGEAILGGPLPGGCVPTPRPPRETTCGPYDYLPPQCWTAPLSIQGGASVVEGDDGSRNMQFTVRLASFATVDVSVDVIADGGTATPGSDYEPIHQRVTIPSRELSRTVNVPIYGDTLDEPNETVVVRLAHADGALIHDDHATGTILDDDPPAISIGDVAVAEGSGGVRHLSFPITLSSHGNEAVSVDVATGGGTATPGVDYEPRSQRVTIPAGSTSVDFPVLVYTDTCDEPDETVHVGLSNPAGGTIHDGHAVGTIQDDDSTPSLSISGVSRAEGDEGTSNAVFTVSLSSPISCEVRVRARTSDGSAVAPGDYVAVDRPVVFSPGETSRTVEVPVVGDETAEPDETFFVDLSEPIAATIAVGRATGTILNDESPWKNVGTGDFDKDGDVDILWRHDTGQLAVWFMDGTTFVSGTSTNPPELSDLAWRVRGTGDFNGDGRVDILWRHEGSGQLAVWFMDGVNLTSGALIDTSDLPDLGWRARGTGDFDADGQADILWQHDGSGQVAVWFMDGVKRKGGTLTTPPDAGDPSWVVSGTGDFSGDGRVDILWRHRHSGQVVVWYMDGTTMTNGTFTTPPAVDDLRWKLVGTGDFNGDGTVDIVWRHNQAGENVVWLMDGVVLQSGVVLRPVY
jgi:hypothetical protein